MVKNMEKIETDYMIENRENRCKHLLERIAKQFNLELFPEHVVFSSKPIWILCDANDHRKFLASSNWNGWEFESLEKMLEIMFMKPGQLFMCTDCRQVPGIQPFCIDQLYSNCIEELEINLDLAGC